MSTTETLFGGLLIVFLIFFASRRAGLSVYWSSVLSSALPFLAYLGYSARQWPGGDVLAIHLVVFMATAGVLGVFASVRQKKEKMHWAPKLIIAFFAALVVFNAMLLSISTHGLPGYITSWFLPNSDHQKVHTVFPGVVPHDRNKLYEVHQQRIEQQRNLGWQVDLRGLEELKPATTTLLVLTIRDRQGEKVTPDRATIGFWRMANSKDDRKLQFKPGANGDLLVEVNLSDPGRWLADVYIERGKDTYQVQRSLLVE